MGKKIIARNIYKSPKCIQIIGICCGWWFSRIFTENEARNILRWCVTDRKNTRLFPEFWSVVFQMISLSYHFFLFSILNWVVLISFKKTHNAIKSAQLYCGSGLASRSLLANKTSISVSNTYCITPRNADCTPSMTIGFIPFLYSQELRAFDCHMSQNRTMKILLAAGMWT